MRILYAGVGDGTCLQRANALRKLGHEVVHVVAGPPRSTLKFQCYRVTNRFKRPADLHGANRRLRRQLRRSAYDLLWIDKGLTIRPRTLEIARRARPRIPIVAYSPDDMMNPGNTSIYYHAGIPLYDLHVTTKSYNVAELRELGATDVLFVDNAYDPETHKPLDLSVAERERYGARVGFIGSYEEDRAEHMWRLAKSGVEVSVWGAGWEKFPKPHPNLVIRNRELPGLDYSKAINATDINLAFLRKVNRDLQTTRSIEIPACRAFMLAERTDEHLRLFEEGEEAEFFDSFDELLTKCRYYLDRDARRKQIAEAAFLRCLRGGYSNEGRLRGVLSYLGGRPLADRGEPAASTVP